MNGASSFTFDVIVVGSGPAGACAALHLARGGARVAILEKARIPRPKTCGGGVVARALRHLPPGFELPVERACRDVTLRFRDVGLELDVRRTEPIVLMTMRAALDEALVRAACAAGATLLDGRALTGIVRTGEIIDVMTTDGPLHARAVVAADGVHSPTARAAGWTRTLDTIPALEAELDVGANSFTEHADRALFDFGSIDAGYGWVFPKRGHLSVGVLTVKRGESGLRAALDRYIDAARVRDVSSRSVSGWLIPVHPRRDGFARSGVLLAGDAAGLADPITLEGISLALHSGKLAAEALLAHPRDARAAGRRYERDLRHEILPGLRQARMLAHLVYRRPRTIRWFFARAGQPLCEGMVDLVTGRTTYGELIVSPRRWTKLATRALSLTH